MDHRLITFSMTCVTLSGCCLALSIKFALPKSTNIFSVPDEIRDLLVLINICPLQILGAGISTNSLEPLESDCEVVSILITSYKFIDIVHDLLGREIFYNYNFEKTVK